MGDTNKGRGTSYKGNLPFLAALLRKLRREKELSQKKVSALIGLSYQGYQKYETGVVVPPHDKLARLADLFGVSTDYLLGREGQIAVREESAYGAEPNLDAMACRLTYHEIMRALDGRPRKLAEFRKLLSTYKEGL